MYVWWKRRHEELVMDREERIVNFLQPYKNAYLIYLEYLVIERQSKVKIFKQSVSRIYKYESRVFLSTFKEITILWGTLGSMWIV
jgi:hypothetical protein